MLGASIPVDLLLLFLLFLLLFFFLLTIHYTIEMRVVGWLESSERVCSFFRDVFVLFSFKFRSSFVYVWSEHPCRFAVVVLLLLFYCFFFFSSFFHNPLYY